MRIDQLRYLSDLQYTNSISKTANRFFLSQQALSNNIRQLETDLNVTLLERSPFGVFLTKEARRILALSDPFIKQMDDLQNQFALQIQGEDSKRIQHFKIFNSSALTTVALPTAIARFQKKYPNIRIIIKEGNHRELFNALENKDCDLSFLSINEDYYLEQMHLHEKDHFHGNILLNDKLIACVSSKSVLAPKEIIEQTDIIKRPFAYLNIVPLKTGNKSDRALYTSHNIEFHRRLLREMDVVTLMPRYVYLNLFDTKHFVARPLEGAQQTIYHSAIYPTENPNPILKEFVNTVISLI